MDDAYHDPHVGLGKIYTRTGDDGKTSLVGGQRLAKDAARIEAYGTVDELNAHVGAARVQALAHEDPLAGFADTLLKVQHALFNLGSCLSTLPEDLHPKQPRIEARHVQALEAAMDRCNKELEPLRSFVLPGSSPLDASLHVCRTVCRRAERRMTTLWRADGSTGVELQYLNRLSDAFFVWGRWVGHRLGDGEVLWQPNQA